MTSWESNWRSLIAVGLAMELVDIKNKATHKMKKAGDRWQ
jgi:hypothetical protein